MIKDNLIYYDNIDKYTNIINKDYYIYKDPSIGTKDIYYNDDTSIITGYGNIVDSLLKSLTPYELEKLRLLASFAKDQGIVNLSNDDLIMLISMVTDPKFDDTIRSIGKRLNVIDNKKPNPANVPVTQPAKPNPTLVQPSPIIRPNIQNIVKEERRANPLIEKFLTDIRKRQGNESFRGWMLPNGELLSQYVDTTQTRNLRQDHSRLFNVFMTGLEQYNKDAYDRINSLYSRYISDHGVSKQTDLSESFAVETLGWMQIAHNGARRIVYRGERWQDRLLRPFLVDYGFTYVTSNFGKEYSDEFMDLYNHIDEIISLGLTQKYQR